MLPATLRLAGMQQVCELEQPWMSPLDVARTWGMLDLGTVS